MRRRLSRPLLALSGLVLLACPRSRSTEAPAPAPEPLAATLVIRDVRLFDGESVVARADVAVQGDTIVGVGPDLAVAGDATVIDGAGKTLLPGLVDAHTHVQSLDQLRQALVFGVTTELDMFSLPAVLGPLRKVQAGAGGRAIADLRSAGILATAPGGHGTEYGFAIPTLTGPDQATAFVENRLSEGSDYLKIVLDDGSALGRPMPTLGVDTVRALVDAAHARELRAVVHVSSQREASAALEAGVDGLAHVFVDGPASDALVRLAADRQVFVAATLAVVLGLCEPGRARALADDPELAPYLAPGDARALAARFPGALPAAACEHALASVAALHRAGVALLAGTDAPNPGTVHGASLHDELALLVRAGLAPTAALAAATSVPADRFGLADRGRVAVGKRADLLLVRGDPTSDIAATRAIEGVWKAGHRLDREGWRAAVAKERAEAEALRAAPPPPGAEAGTIAAFEAAQVAADFGAGWQPSTDALIGGTSTVELGLVKKGARKSKGALRVTGTVAAAGAPAQWAGAMFFPGAAPMQPANLSQFRTLVFAARGDATTSALTVMVFAARLGPAPLRKEIAVGREWGEYAISFAELGDLEPYDLTGLFFGATAPGPFALEIDDVRLE